MTAVVIDFKTGMILNRDDDIKAEKERAKLRMDSLLASDVIANELMDMMAEGFDCHKTVMVIPRLKDSSFIVVSLDQTESLREMLRLLESAKIKVANAIIEEDMND